MGEGEKPLLAMIGADAGCADASKGQRLIAEVPERVVERDAAGVRLRQHALARCRVAAKEVERQGIRPRVDFGDRLIDRRVGLDGKHGPEDLFLHHRHVRAHASQQGRRQLAADGARCVGGMKSHYSRTLAACIFDQAFEP